MILENLDKLFVRRMIIETSEMVDPKFRIPFDESTSQLYEAWKTYVYDGCKHCQDDKQIRFMKQILLSSELEKRELAEKKQQQEKDKDVNKES